MELKILFVKYSNCLSFKIVKIFKTSEKYTNDFSYFELEWVSHRNIISCVYLNVNCFLQSNLLTKNDSFKIFIKNELKLLANGYNDFYSCYVIFMIVSILV